MARGKKAPRDAWITIRITASEKELLTGAARKFGLDLSSLIRLAIMLFAQGKHPPSGTMEG